MYNRFFSLTIVLALMSLCLNAQNNFKAYPDYPESRLKVDIEGSYPQHVEESTWWDNAWIPFATQDIQYAANGDVEVFERADASGKTRDLYSYNDAGFPIQSISQLWVDGDWENVYREKDDIDDDGFYLGYTFESWIDGAWVLQEGMEYQVTKDGDKLIGMIVRIKHEGADWVNMQRYAYTYEAGNDNFTLVVIESWIDGAWVMSTKIEYTFIDDKTTESITSMWNGTAWVVFGRMITEDGDNGSYSLTHYSKVGDEWIPSSRSRNENDSHGNEILSITEIYSDGWVPLMGTQYLLTYDGNNLIQRITQSSFNDPDNEMKTLNYENTLKEVFSNFYSASSGGILADNMSLVVYPNPAVNELFVKISNPGQEDKLEVKIFSLSGQLVLEKSLSTKKGIQQISFQVSSLKAGSYLFQVQNQSGSFLSNRIIQIQ